MTGRIGRRTAVLATSGLVSIAVTLGAGAGVAQAAPPGHGPKVKKESTSITLERVLWFEGKDKKEWPHHNGDSRGEDESPEYGEDDGGPRGREDLAAPGGQAGLDDFASLVNEAGFVAPAVTSLEDLAGQQLAPGDAADAEVARLAPHDDHKKHKKHKNVSKRKDSITLERVLWFEGRHRPHRYDNPRGEGWGDPEDPWTEAAAAPGEADEQPAAEDLDAPGSETGAYAPVAYRPGGGHEHDKDLVKKKIRIILEKTLWFKKHHGHYPWEGGDDVRPGETSAPVSGL